MVFSRLTDQQTHSEGETLPQKEDGTLAEPYSCRCYIRLLILSRQKPSLLLGHWSLAAIFFPRSPGSSLRVTPGDLLTL